MLGAMFPQLPEVRSGIPTSLLSALVQEPPCTALGFVLFVPDALRLEGEFFDPDSESSQEWPDLTCCRRWGSYLRVFHFHVLHEGDWWCLGWDSNPQHSDLESPALPIELPKQKGIELDHWHDPVGSGAGGYLPRPDPSPGWN